MVIRSGGNLLLQNGYGNYAFKVGTNNYCYVNKKLYIDCLPADNRATVEASIFSSIPTITSVFGGDNIFTAYWGCAICLNAGGATNGYGGGNNTQSYVPGYSAFTVNTRTSTSATTFDKNLFTVMPNGNVSCTGALTVGGQLTLKTNYWHQSDDGIFRFFYNNNGTTFFHSGNTNGEGFVFRNTAQNDIFNIKDTGTIACTGAIYVNGNSIVFPNQLSDNKIQFWTGYSIGIQSSELKFVCPTDASHRFYTNGYNNVTIYKNGNLGVNNQSPIGMITAGNANVAGSDGHIVVGKQDNGGGTRQLRMGYNSGFSFVLGDYGNSNVAGSWIEQFKISYQSPALTLVCYPDGSVGTKNGNVVSTSDERLKTDIHTIENALEKTLLLRGVNFTYIQEQTKSIGLISQEVELIIPEVVHEYDGIKSIAYSNMIGLLVEAIKELNNKIINLENKII